MCQTAKIQPLHTNRNRPHTSTALRLIAGLGLALFAGCDAADPVLAEDLDDANASLNAGAKNAANQQLETRDFVPPRPPPLEVDLIFNREHQWTQGQPERKLASAEDGFCYLTGITGNYRGFGEAVTLELRLNTRGGYDWFLTGRSLQDGVGAKARCVRYSAFRNTAPFIHFTTGLGLQCTRVAPPPSPGTIDFGPFCPVWQTDSACFLSGISGALSGADDSTGISASSSSFNGYQSVEIQVSRPGGALTAYTQCVNLGKTRYQLALSPSPGAPGTDRGYRWSQGALAVPLLPVSQGICYLTGIQGNFRGAGESVQITQSGGSWLLSGASMQTGVRAEARCLSYDGYTSIPLVEPRPPK